MMLARLRLGEYLALLGAGSALGVLFLRWFDLRSGTATVAETTTGFGSLGWFALAIVLFACVAILGLCIATATERSPAFPVGLQIVAVLASFAALGTVILRVIFEPGLGVGAEGAQVDLALAAYLGLASCLLMVVGTWVSIADERTDTRSARAQTERLLGAPGVDRPLPGGGEAVSS